MKSKKDKTAAQIVALSRAPEKITTPELIKGLFADFIEFHGDRNYQDDQAIVAGIGTFKKKPVTIIATDKGVSPKERIAKNFGCPSPGGYKKALRLAKQAEKFNRPVIAFVNTSGAYPGRSAEEHGQGEAIARNLLEFSTLKVPFVTVIFGEGGSGGALALGVCDELAMLENAEYSVVSPRGFASILWKDASREEEACNIMKITAEDMVRLGVAETVIEEPLGGAHNDLDKISENIKEYLSLKIEEKLQKDIDVLLKERYTKFRKIGDFQE